MASKSHLSTDCACGTTPADTSKTDVEKTYVDTAIETGFAVIDVNLPKYLTDDDVSDGTERMKEGPRG